MRIVRTSNNNGDVSKDHPMTIYDRNAHEWPELIALSPCLLPMALYFGKQLVGGKLPLYFANNSGSDLIRASVSSKGTTVDGDDLIETGLGGRHLGNIPKVMGV